MLAKFLAVILLAAPAAFATNLFSDTFESSFPGSNWITNYTGAVVTDPLNPANHVLHFTGYGSGGDLFSSVFSYPAGWPIQVDFDFLNQGTAAANTGGYLGTNHGCCFPQDEEWVFSNLTSPIGAWTHFSLVFPVRDTNNVGSFNIKLEQAGTGQPVGSMYFDNITVAAIPEPATFTLMGLGLAIALFRYRRSIG